MRPLIVGNWKMNGCRADAGALAGGLAERWRREKLPVEMVLCPPATLIAEVEALVAGSGIRVGGQDCHAVATGAFTGDIGAPMLADLGCSAVIVGHSERRAGHGETDRDVRAKAEAACAAGLMPIVCVGEHEEEREAGLAERRCAGQIRGSLPPRCARVAVAYEPVWAIGSGRTPSSADIVAMHKAIRETLVQDDPDGRAIPILYGGSVKAENAAEILALPEVGGVLVGGASLDAEAFWAIAKAAVPAR